MSGDFGLTPKETARSGGGFNSPNPKKTSFWVKLAIGLAILYAAVELIAAALSDKPF